MNLFERRVHFLPEHDTILEIERLEDYTEEDALNYWFTETEMAKIALRSYKDALKFEAGKKSSDKYMRGLEGSTQEGQGLHDSAVRLCIDAVMDEQEAQWSNEEDDYDRLAAVCLEVSAPSVTLALERAKEDELEALRIYQDLKTENTNKSEELHFLTRSYSKPIELDDLTSMCSDISLPDSFTEQ